MPIYCIVSHQFDTKDQCLANCIRNWLSDCIDDGSELALTLSLAQCVVGAPGIWLADDSDSDLEDKDLKLYLSQGSPCAASDADGLGAGRQSGADKQDLTEGSVLETFADSLRKRPLPHRWQTEAGIH